MLHIHYLQHVFNLSDPAAEKALYDSQAVRAFVGINISCEPAPDKTTILKFRHLLDKHDLGTRVFEVISTHLDEKGLFLRKGTMIDASIIHTPRSTKNEDKTRNPVMHQTKMGNQWYFGMKTHIGVNHVTKMVHSVVATADNVYDSTNLPDLLLGSEKAVWGDSAYTGQAAVILQFAPSA
ncbi:MAG: IS5 family transposase [Calditrichaeota bacterium]|nr:IS5 family transposase [Calditrichota bacterium]